MEDTARQLKQLGFDPWYLDNVPAEECKGLLPARVVAVHKDSFMISKGQGATYAELVGRLRFGADASTDLPTVGDWVLAALYDDGSVSIIHKVLPRKTVLKRKTAGKKIDLQLIAANIDIAFIMQSLNEDFNPRRLERYLVVVNDGHIRPIVLLSKRDLLSDEEVDRKVAAIETVTPGLTVVAFSNQSKSDLVSIKELLRPGQTCCLLGSSGVGKTTLLNNLVGEPGYSTREVRAKDGKGRHATTSRQLVSLAEGAMVVDTPGMRELGIVSGEAGLGDTFAEIEALSKSCRFSDCTHDGEAGCAVAAAVQSGRLSEKRYANYIKMKKEAAFNEMSYVEKRRSDKNLGKFYKSVLQQKKNRW